MIAGENAFLWSYLWQSTAFVTAGLVSSYALRRRPCRAHHVMLLAIVASVIVPIGTASVKHLGVGLFASEPVPIHRPVESVANHLPVEKEFYITGQPALVTEYTEVAQIKSTRAPVPEYPPRLRPPRKATNFRGVG